MAEQIKPIAAIYVRVSTEEQASLGLSIPAQIETLKQYCQAFGITVYKIYEDPGISGKDTINRPALSRLIKDSQKALFNMILVWKISRLTRNLKDLLYLIDKFEKEKITFASYSEKFDTSTPVGRMTLQLLGSIAEFERNTIVENVKLGLREYARRGGKTGTVLGYKSDCKTLVVEEKEAATVRIIFDMYVNKGQSLSNIAKQLNDRGFRTKSGKYFRSDGIARILGNPVYIGINRHQLKTDNSYEVMGNHEPIIAESIWKAAQNKLRFKYSSAAKRPVNTRSMLGGIVCCPLCKNPMVLYYSTAKGKHYRYYKCSRHNGRALYFSAGKIEGTAVTYLKAMLRNSQVLKDVENSFYWRLENRITHQKSQGDINAEKAAILKLMDKYLSLLDGELINRKEVVNDKLRQLAHKINDLDSRLEMLDTAEDAETNIRTADFSNMYHNFIESLLDMEQGSLNTIYKAFIGGITPCEDKKNISCSFCFPVGFD